MKELIPASNAQSAVQFLSSAICDAHDIRQKIEYAFLRMTRQQRVTRRPRMRIFASNGTRDDYTSRYLSTPAPKGITLEEHLEYLWPEGYCIAVNDISCWSQSIHDLVVNNFTCHWLKRYGESIGGIDIYSFIGRYESTPFGIHKDDEDSYLFNMGPGLKRVFIWEKEDLVRTFGENALRNPVFDYKSKLQFCQTFELRKGDGLLIPKGAYHILESPEYSVMLGIAPYLGSTSELIKGALNRLYKPIVSNIKFTEYEDGCGNISLLKDALTKATASFSYLDIHNSIQCEISLLKSNNFIRGAHIASDKPFNPLASYKLPSNHLIERVQLSGRLHVFCRGHELSFGNIGLTNSILDEIISTNYFTASTLTKKLHEKVSNDTIIDLLSTLYDCGAIHEASAN